MDDKIKLQQRVEIIAQEVDKLKTQGGGSGEGYTKDEADAKFETQTHASTTFQPKSAMSNYLTTSAASETYQVKGEYLTATDIEDMATKTWVGQQGYLTDAEEVPTVTSSDNGKILTASYSGGEGSYAWTDPQTYSQVQADWDQTDNSAVDYIKNKPTIPAAQVNADWNAVSGVAEILNKPTLGTAAAASTSDFATATQGGKADTALQPGDLSGYATETWVGQQGYLTSADEVPDVGSSDDGKVLTASYSGGAGSYAWATPATPADMATQTWVGQQGYLTSAAEVPTVTSGDDAKVLTADYTNGTASYSWETVPTPADMATQTWVGQQGYLTSADEVPAVGSSDDGKVLTASYSGGQGSYSWETPSGGNTPATIMDCLVFLQASSSGIKLYDDNNLLNSLMTADNTIIGFKYTIILPVPPGNTKINGIKTNLYGENWNFYGEVTCKVSVSTNVLTGEVIFLNSAGIRTIPVAMPNINAGHSGYAIELDASQEPSYQDYPGKWFVEPIYAT